MLGGAEIAGVDNAGVDKYGGYVARMDTPAISVNHYASAVLGDRNSICQSVCRTRDLWENKRTYCRYFDTIWKGITHPIIIVIIIIT